MGCALVERYTYDPYGQTYIEDPATQTFRGWSRFGNPWSWTGQRFDATTGLYHFLFRSYSPRLGRWLQRDPAGYRDGPNLYKYLSDPLGGWDPLGLDPCDHIRERIKAVLKDRDRMVQQGRSLTGELRDLEKQEQELSDQVTSLEGQIDTLEDRIDDIDKDIKDVKTQGILAGVITAGGAVIAIIPVVVGGFPVFVGGVVVAGADVTYELDKAIADKWREEYIAELNKEKGRWEAKIAQTKQQIDKLRNSLNPIRDKMDKIKKELASIRDTLDENYAYHRRLRDELRECERNNRRKPREPKCP